MKKIFFLKIKRQVYVALVSIFILAFLLALAPISLSNPVVGGLDPTFKPGIGVTGLGGLYTVALQPDGKMLIGGFFASYNGSARQFFARLNTNGSLDTTFKIGLGPNSILTAIAIQPDGKVLIGGWFTNYNGTSRNYIVRLNSNGSLDTTFTAVEVTSLVEKIILQSDGKILIARSSYGIARLNSDGSLDTTFHSQLLGCVGEAIALQTDGKVLFGGNCNNKPYFTRLKVDGSLDTTFNTGTGPNSFIKAILVQPSGKVLIGGGFTRYNGTIRKKIARLNSNGSLDTTFNPGSGADDAVWVITRQPDGKVLIGGWFNQYNGFSRNRIARLNINGTLDTTFNPGTGANYAIYDIAIQPDKKLVFGGYFTNFNGKTRNGIARLNSTGSLDVTFAPRFGVLGFGLVSDIALQMDGKVLIGGWFYAYNGISISGIARINSDGSLDKSFYSSSGTCIPNAIALQSDGKVLVVGSSSIERLNSDGSDDITFNPGTGTNKGILAVVLQSNGKILIGGYFDSYNGSPRSGIARLNKNGSLDTTFNPGTGIDGFGEVRAIALQPDGKILIGGIFNKYNGVVQNQIARLNSNGSLDKTFNSGTGVDDGYRVDTIILQPDGKVLIGGDFGRYNGIDRNGIARLNRNGSLDTSFEPKGGTSGNLDISREYNIYDNNADYRITQSNSSNSYEPKNDIGYGTDGEVYSISLQPDGRILIVGNFTNVNGKYRKGIALLNSNGSLDSSFNPGTGVNDTIAKITLQPDGKAIIGGWFTRYNNVMRNGIARLIAMPSTLPTLLSPSE